jgi:glycosyltransferase involved in cell wall biosynthesis
LRSIRIIHAIRSDGFAGVERFVARLAVAQNRAGHRVRVIGGDPARMIAALRPHPIMFTEAKRTSETWSAIRRWQDHADVVNTHMTAADVAAALALSMNRQPPALVSTRHFTQARGADSRMPIDAILRHVIAQEISISHAVASSIGLPSTVVHSGLEFRPPPRVPRRRVVLVAQRLQPEKQTALAIEAFARSGLADVGWEMHISGAGSERTALEALTHQLGLGSDVRFLGQISDVSALMDASSILIAPCAVEGLGLTVIEAMQAELPVVAARAGGHVELLTGLDPLLMFEPGDVNEAAANLRAFATDEARRRSAGTQMRMRQEADYAIEGQVAGTVEVYLKALAHNARKRRR